jgi:magnesium transporter
MATMTMKVGDPAGGCSEQLLFEDLLDPDEEQLRAVWPDDLHPTALETLTRSGQHTDEPRPRLEAHGSYVVGLLVIPVVVPDEDRVYYQQVHLLLTSSRLVVVRKTPVDGEPFDLSSVRTACRQAREASIGMYAFRLVDEVAERYLTLMDDLSSEVEELEENIEEWSPEEVRMRLGALRHDMLRIRRTLTPTCAAIRSVIDDRLEIEGVELFPHDIELHFSGAHDKLLRASEGVELARDLVAGIRDYHQAKVANDQNEVMKRLTAIASILLVPTLIVGFYGQNLHGGPEEHWAYGYWFSWILIIGSTLLQLAYFRKRRWI